MTATGQRGSTPVSPMNRTGKIFQRQQREAVAKKAATSIDINEVKHQAWLEGFDQGFTAGWDALAQHLVDEGVLDADEPADESKGKVA
jgi:hypothetical protein